MVPSDPSAPWFMCTAVGKNTLSKMLATMCTEAGISGRKIDHSLRAHAATELFRARVPEKVIQDRSGHRTLEGLCKYERISDKQRQEACKALRYSYITPGRMYLIYSHKPKGARCNWLISCRLL